MTEPTTLPATTRKADWLASIDTAQGAPGALAPTAFEPADLPSLVKVAELFSRSNLVPEPLRGKPDDVLLVLWTGREYGFGMIGALKNIHVIKGNTTFSADSLHAMVERSGLCQFFHLIETTGEQATYETQRKGAPKPVSLTFTLADAKQAGLLQKPNWQANTKAMLRAAAKRSLARAVYGDLIAGLHTPDEIVGNGEVIDVTPEPAGETKVEKIARKAREKREVAPPPVPDVEAVEVSPGEPDGRPAQIVVPQTIVPGTVIEKHPSTTFKPVPKFYRTPDFVEALEARASVAGLTEAQLEAKSVEVYGFPPREIPDKEWAELCTWVEKQVALREEEAQPAGEKQVGKLLNYAALTHYGAPEEPEVALRNLAQRKLRKKLDDVTLGESRELARDMQAADAARQIAGEAR